MIFGIFPTKQYQIQNRKELLKIFKIIHEKEAYNFSLQYIFHGFRKYLEKKKCAIFFLRIFWNVRKKNLQIWSTFGAGHCYVVSLLFSSHHKNIFSVLKTRKRYVSIQFGGKTVYHPHFFHDQKVRNLENSSLCKQAYPK